MLGSEHRDRGDMVERPRLDVDDHLCRRLGRRLGRPFARLRAGFDAVGKPRVPIAEAVRRVGEQFEIAVGAAAQRLLRGRQPVLQALQLGNFAEQIGQSRIVDPGDLGLVAQVGEHRRARRGTPARSRSAIRSGGAAQLPPMRDGSAPSPPPPFSRAAAPRRDTVPNRSSHPAILTQTDTRRAIAGPHRRAAHDATPQKSPQLRRILQIGRGGAPGSGMQRRFTAFPARAGKFPAGNPKSPCWEARKSLLGIRQKASRFRGFRDFRRPATEKFPANRDSPLRRVVASGARVWL